jgi:hypothetical protein
MLAVGVLAALALAACGSTATPTPTTSTTALGSVRQQECTLVGGVLANGPDPDADPVGYADAQILPLRQLQVDDAQLHRAVLQLAAAYQSYSGASRQAGPAAAVQVSKSEAAVNAICPGVAN